MLGEQIKRLRELKNINQKQLASMLGVSTSTVGMYEQNRRSPDKDMLLKIAEVFNVSIDYLLGSNTKSSNVHPRYKDIDHILSMAKDQLMHHEGLMFNGEPATQEAIQSILDAMEMGMALAKEKNKKYSNKKSKK